MQTTSKREALPYETLRVEILPDGQQATLLNVFSVRDCWGVLHIVPKGFTTDFASVPRFFWRLVPPWGRYSPAAVVHDYLYRTGKASRKEADRVFLRLMKQLDVPCWKRWVMYWGVRLFGFRAYQGNK